jgi:hypothetical protein
VVDKKKKITTTRRKENGMNPSMTRWAQGLLIVALLVAWWKGAGRHFGLMVFATLLAVAAWIALQAWRAAIGRRVVARDPLPPHLRGKLRAEYPALSDAQIDDVERGLRQYFAAYASAGGRFVAMPSKVVDALWHEFILHTRAYDGFCRRAFGRMLHHTPAEAFPEGAPRDDKLRAGLRRAWYWSCREEKIDPRKPNRLPLLFALDAALLIPGGYRYVPDCSLLGADRGDTHCGTSVGCGSSCGSGCGGDGGGGDGGCGGGGCGGGGD